MAKSPQTRHLSREEIRGFGARAGGGCFSSSTTAAASEEEEGAMVGSSAFIMFTVDSSLVVGSPSNNEKCHEVPSAVPVVVKVVVVAQKICWSLRMETLARYTFEYELLKQ